MKKRKASLKNFQALNILLALAAIGVGLHTAIFKTPSRGGGYMESGFGGLLAFIGLVLVASNALFMYLVISARQELEQEKRASCAMELKSEY